jgi:hypothetical protein
VGGWNRPNSGWSPVFELKWVGDHEDGLVVEDEFAHERLAAIRPGRVRRVDAAGGHREAWLVVRAGEDGDRSRGVAAGAVDECDTGGVVDEPDADVAARLAPVGEVDGVDLAPLVLGSPGGDDGRGEQVKRLVGRRRRPRRHRGCPAFPAFGELVDETLSRAPVAQMVRRTDGDPNDWPKVDVDVPPELLAEARRRTQTQRGQAANREEVVARLAQVAEVARTAPSRGMLRALGGPPLHLSPAVAKKLLRQARDAGLLEHSTRSEQR